MPKLALNFICKNESHVILDMLESVRSITDIIVAVDTGSTDNTIETIKEFGNRYKILTFVFQRPFDNFCNSRNYALNKLTEIVKDEIRWNLADSYGFFIDCDEILHLSEQFEKDTLKKDIYYISVHSQNSYFTRQFLYKLSKPIFWKYPVHETICCDDPLISEEIMDDSIYINCKSNGASWKENLEEKFFTHAKILEEYIGGGNGDFRSFFYTGNSYITAAQYCPDPKRKSHLLLESKKFYIHALNVTGGNKSDEIVIQRRLGEIRILLGQSWPETRSIFLHTYAKDIRLAEPFYRILHHYIYTMQWETAYLFSHFSYKLFHGKTPFGSDVARVEYSLYQWKIFFSFFLSCYHTNRIKEAKKVYSCLNKYIDDHPEYFKEKDLTQIRKYSPFNLAINNFKARLRIKVGERIQL